MTDFKLKLKGTEAFKEGNFKKAVKFFNKFQEEHDKDDTVLSSLAEAYLKLGNNNDAIGIYTKLARLQISKASFIDAKVTLRLLMNLKKDDPAIHSMLAEVEASLGNLVTAVEFYVNGHNFYMDQGKTKSALNLLEKAKNIQPENIDIDLLMAECYKIDGYITHSLRAYISAIQKLSSKKNFPGAERALSAMQSFGDDIPELYYAYGIVLNAKGEFDQAITQFQHALEVLPTFFEALIGIGQSLCNKGNYSKAMHFYNEAEKIEPGEPKLLESIGDVFMKKKLFYDALEKYLHAFEGFRDMNRYIEIFQLFSKILSIHPENLYILENWGDILLGLGNIEEAVMKYEKCFNFYIKEQLFENAIEIGQKILQIAPDHSELAIKLSQIKAGITPEVQTEEIPETLVEEPISEISMAPRCRTPEEKEECKQINNAIQNNNFDEAIQLVDLMIQHDKNYPDYYIIKAEILVGMDKFNDSIFNYEKAAGLFAKVNDFQRSVYAYKQVTSLLESIKAEKQEVKETSSDAYDDKTMELIEDYIKDGDKYLKDGNVKEAKEVYNKILNVYPNFIQAKEKLSELNLIETFEQRAREVIEEGDYYSNFNLGIAFKEMGLYDQAIEQLKLSLNDKQYALPSIELIAATYEDQNLFDQSIKWLQEGLNKPGYSSKDFLPLKYELGKIYERIGNLGNAIKWYNEVFKQDFNFRSVGKKLAILGKKINRTSQP